MKLRKAVAIETAFGNVTNNQLRNTRVDVRRSLKNVDQKPQFDDWNEPTEMRI